MEYDFLMVFKLVIAVLLPTCLALGLTFLDQKTKFHDLRESLKQLVYGLLFGVIAIAMVELGVDDDVVRLSIACATPMVCGLLFGAPSAILSAVLGGLYRWICLFYHQGTQLEMVTEIIVIGLAALIGALAKKFLFSERKPSGTFGLILGIFLQVIHMLLLFLMESEGIKSAYYTVFVLVVPLMISTAVSTSLPLFSLNLLNHFIHKKAKEKIHISEVFQYMLLVAILGCFSLTSFLTYYLQTKVAEADYTELLSLNMYDLEVDVVSYSDQSLLKEVQTCGKSLSSSSSYDDLVNASSQYDIYELDIVSPDGKVINSNHMERIDYDLNTDEKFQYLLGSIYKDSTYVMDLTQSIQDSNLSMKYIGVKLDSGFLLAGYSLSQYQASIDDQYILAVSNRHIGEKGDILIYDEELNALYDRTVLGGIETAKESIVKLKNTQKSIIIVSIHGEDSFAISFQVENLLFVIYYPASDALVNRNIAFMLMCFMEAIAYCILFCVIYALLDRSIVRNVHKINQSLEKITSGQLDEKVDVRANYEFDSLSDDINCTVTSLKEYIDAEKKRNEREVRLAREIQESSLPNLFPAYPNRNDFDIHATMEAAKEVGGDFYDFYLVDGNHLVFLIADVSGKGIPAAMFMMKAKTLIKNLVENGKTIDEAFQLANSYLLEGNKARMFVTAWIGYLDLRDGKLEYVNAGHNPPLLLKRDGRVIFLREKPNFVLAGSKKSHYERHELKLNIGDFLFLYTDGVTEAMDKDGSLYSPERLEKTLMGIKSELTPKDICQLVKKDMDEFVQGADQSDDVTMLCVKIDHFQSKDSILTYPDEGSYPKVVSFVEGRLDHLEVEPKIKSKALIALDEIYSNIIKYASAKKATVSAFKTENHQLLLKFVYDGVRFDFHEAENPDVTLPLKERKQGGLGLYIVRKTASDVTYEYEDGMNILKVYYSLMD
jgi:serine phosphatase RsbU (regulator of sigma subunit)/anti-sigma regulatory factor (Ser/Thr protein kinase)